MSQKMLEALKKRVGGSFGLSPPAKKSKGGEPTPSREKTPTEMVIALSKEQTLTGLKITYAYSRAKSATSKNAAISNTMRVKVDLARKDADEARVQLGAIRIELGEVNKKLLTAEKKVANLTKDLQSSNQLEAAIASLSKDVNNLQEEREVLRAVFHRLEEEKKTKEEELKVEVEKYKSKARQHRAQVERLGGKNALKMAYAYSRAKSATSKNAAISNTMRARVDLANKDANEARVQLGPIQMELGEVNKKLLTAEKKVAKLTKDLQASNQFEAAIASQSKDVNNLQEEREVLRAVFHRLEEEKKTKEEEL
ncbi:uncharacterized protein LOC133038420 [Cannabis sativa]|uniref:uncharacterized protein LOC133038420 n=1 Tax=Cannabis sativa TaxID=3483 RepID=UPI0029CA4B60|nr:uncharacterized protein LOC133038420 [Cannabis sativa]